MGTVLTFKPKISLLLLARSPWVELVTIPTLIIGVAPPVVLEATNAKALDFVTIEQLESRAVTERNEL